MEINSVSGYPYQPAGSGASGITKVANSSGASNTTRIYDKMDLNQDGIVSAAEELAYYQKHPEEALKKKSQENVDNRKGRYLDLLA